MIRLFNEFIKKKHYLINMMVSHLGLRADELHDTYNR